MKREIKFRAWSRTGEWDEEGEKRQFEMIGADNLAFYCADLLKNLLKDSDDDFYIMQFTGIKDKNGVDIYEGDITSYVSSYLSHPRNLVVMFELGSFLQKEIDPKGYCEVECDIWIGWEELEVIGNIYENPELLGKDQTNA